MVENYAAFALLGCAVFFLLARLRRAEVEPRLGLEHRQHVLAPEAHPFSAEIHRRQLALRAPSLD